MAHFSGTLKAWDKKPGEDGDASDFSTCRFPFGRVAPNHPFVDWDFPPAIGGYHWKPPHLQELPVLASDYSRCGRDSSLVVLR